MYRLAGKPAFFNQEHDLSYLATFAGAGPISASPFVIPIAAVALLVIAQIVSSPVGAPLRHADFRAPPAR